MKFGGSILMVLLFVTRVGAQWPDDSGSLASQRYGEQRGFAIRGQVSCDSIFLGSLSVELLSSGHSVGQSTSLGADGSFEFRSVSPGTYDLQITGSARGVVHEQRVVVTGPNDFLSITVPVKGNADRSAAATVSYRQLQHKIPSPAQKEYGKGLTAAKKGDQQTALDHFQKAIDIDPEFADAYTNIGVAQISMGQLDKAVEQFQKTINLAPDHTVAIANLSIALCRLKRFQEAGVAARQALRLDPRLLKMRYILAVSLAKGQGHETEALDNLARAASEIPKAHLLAADILTHIGRRDDAASQLEQYLRALPEQDTDRKTVEKWLAELRNPLTNMSRHDTQPF